ncbi:hypothetical protein K438DRAFT_1777681 [Mycena galopus ATCC 62051]|nr:hypothetical protein K438DRAFT_1777681 [Mycena galopus ATCC 62051]
MVSTLNSLHISADDYVVLSGMDSVTIRFPKTRRGTYAKFRYCNMSHRSTAPFPHHSAGFLYYHNPPNGLPLEGSVRLRVTLDKNPASFTSGQDLLLPSGAPWQTILPQIACREHHTLICQQLLREKLVTEEHLSRARRIFAGSDRITPQLILFRINQLFPVNFGASVQLTVVGKKLHKLDFPHLFSDEEGRFPWTGSALACFEPSTRSEHIGRRVVSLRLVQIIDPVACVAQSYRGRLPKPQEGQLLTGDGVAPWAYEIDNQSSPAEALRVLWDNSRIASLPG